MEYRNIKTGIVIDSPCKITGEFWVEVEEGVDPETPGTPETPPVDLETPGTPETPPVDLETPGTPETPPVEAEEPGKEIEPGDITRKEIMAELDAFGIQYNKKMAKPELLALLGGK